MCAYERNPCDPDMEEIERIALATGGRSRLYKDRAVHDYTADVYRLWVIRQADFLMAQPGGFLAWDENQSEARINTLAVDPEKQGEGIGSNLLRAWMSMMVGKKKVIAGTQEDNPARSFYETHGFKIERKEITFHR